MKCKICGTELEATDEPWNVLYGEIGHCPKCDKKPEERPKSLVPVT